MIVECDWCLTCSYHDDCVHFDKVCLLDGYMELVYEKRIYVEKTCDFI